MGRDFIIKTYTIRTDKVKKRLTAVLLTDLHCNEHGEENREVLFACRELNPDLILTAGDLVTAGTLKKVDGVYCFLKKLIGVAPIYSVNGNHEMNNRTFYPNVYARYLRVFDEIGIHLLTNESETVECRGEILEITGLEIPAHSYKKLRKPRLSEAEIEERIRVGEREHFSILLCHNPQFIPLYFKTGADLTLCGHFHSGIMRFPNDRVLVSPYGIPFPKFGYGLYESEGKTAVVSAGMGEHLIPFRIHNPMEIVQLIIEPQR